MKKYTLYLTKKEWQLVNPRNKIFETDSKAVFELYKKYFKMIYKGKGVLKQGIRVNESSEISKITTV